MKRFVYLLSLIVLLTACGTTTSSVKTGSTPTPDTSPVVYGVVGKPVTMRPWVISLQAVKLIDPSTIAQHSQLFPSVTANERFLILDEYVQNISKQSANIAGMQFNLQDTHGNANFGVQLGVPEVTDQSLGGTLAPSMQQVGQDAYIVPANIHSFYWVYTATDNLHQVIWKFTV